MRCGGESNPLPAPKPKEHCYRKVCIPTICGATDYKGEIRLADKRYCHPLTVTDHASRYVPLCDVLESSREELGFPRL
jgi:hypothetical protein